MKLGIKRHPLIKKRKRPPLEQKYHKNSLCMTRHYIHASITSSAPKTPSKSVRNLIPNPTDTPPLNPLVHITPSRIPNLNIANPPPAHTPSSVGAASWLFNVLNSSGLRASEESVSTFLPRLIFVQKWYASKWNVPVFDISSIVAVRFRPSPFAW
jgi:hypothetical protein